MADTSKSLSAEHFETVLDQPYTMDAYTIMNAVKAQVKTSDYIWVSNKGLENVVKDIIKLKQSLSKVLAIDGMSFLYKKIYTLEQEICNLKTELDKKINETEFLKNKSNGLMEEIEKYREENFQLKNRMNVVNQERSEDYEACLSFVSVCLSLLWGVSLNDECVSIMLSWKNIEKFLDSLSRSVGALLESNKAETQLEDDSEEFTLLLSVGGIITNIAATALGREFLMTKEVGVRVLDNLILHLSEISAQRGVQIKNLILKVIYNISINAKGLKYLTSKKGLITTLGLLLQEETDAELRLYLVKCIQSLTLEPENTSQAHEILEVVSISTLQEYADLSKGDLKKAMLELISDLTVFMQTQP